MVTIKALYIDDEIDRSGRDAQKIKQLLELPGEFECQLRRPPKEFSGLPSPFPDVLLVDLDLGQAPPNGEPVNYFGTTLASEMRMRNPCCPIILITKPQLMAEKGQILEGSIDVDLILIKDEVNRNPEGTRALIVSLVRGFQALESILGKDWQDVLRLMGVEDDEPSLLTEAAPPLVQGRWNTPQLARWIRNVIMGFPGILYDDLTAATRLGISLDSFRTLAVQKLVQPAKYTGVFGDYRERWWRNRLFRIAQTLLIRHGVRGPLFETFREAFKEESGEQLQPAICVFDGSPGADWVCYVLSKPVKQQHSIPYYPDSRPPVMDQARVSFKAIQESNKFDERLVDIDSYNTVVKKLWGQQN